MEPGDNILETGHGDTASTRKLGARCGAESKFQGQTVFRKVLSTGIIVHMEAMRTRRDLNIFNCHNFT